MRHLKAGRKFKRSPEHRQMMLRNLATALLQHEKITTTVPKAKELQPYVEKLISLARGGFPEKPKVEKGETPTPEQAPAIAVNATQLAKFRRALAVLTSKDVCFKLFNEIGPRFASRPGGYTRIYKLAKVRQGDAAAMAVIMLIPAGEEVSKAPQRPAVVPAQG
jgi:large subunit ribosomal protein L17